MGRRSIVITFSVICVLFVASVFPLGFNLSYNEHHSDPKLTTKTQDVTFHWEKSLAHGDWDKICLWDLGWAGHCYISFHYSLDTSMDVPATLSATYPRLLEPNQIFLIETKLETTGDRIIEIKPAIFFGIDISIPLSPKSFKATYGGQWAMTFNLNTKNVQQMLEKVWLGDFTDGQMLSIAKDALPLERYVTLQRLDIGSVGLGTLVLGEIKIDLLKAVRDALLLCLSVPPSLLGLIDKLSWFLSLLKVSSGLLITPKISAYASCPIQSSSNFASLGTNLVQFVTDLSPKNVQLSIATDAKEKNGTNEFAVKFSPISFSYLFDVGWQYYFDINVGLLGFSLYQDEWTFDIFRGPCVNWDSQPIQTSLEIASKIDEPMQVTEPSVNDGSIALDLNDPSGISEVALYYSLDKVIWNSTTLSRTLAQTGTTYSQRPMSSVLEDTVVYYYLKATDGDGDPYYIGTAANCYNFTLKPSLFSILQSPQNLAILSVVVIFVAVVTGAIVFRKRTRNKIPRPEGD